MNARSTTWFFQYDNKQWIEHFQVSRPFMRQLILKLKHKMEKKEDTKYKCVVPVNIKVTCSLYKLAHVAKYLQCSEHFIIRKSIVHLVLHKFVHAMNKIFKNQVRWVEGNNLLHVMEGIKELSNLPSIQGAIDVVQIHIQKLKAIFVGDYYTFKSKAYSLHLQAIVDHKKRFLDIFVYMHGSKMLRLLSIYQKATL